jgi:hypothetical protein
MAKPHGFGREEKSIDRILFSVFPGDDEDHSGCAAGLCLCEPIRGGFSYGIIGSIKHCLADQKSKGLPRDIICVYGELTQVSFLVGADNGRRSHFLVVPRGIEAVVAAGWRPGMLSRDFVRPVRRAGDFLTAVAFDWGSQLRFIGDKAFARCDALSSFVLPAAVERIGLSSFGSCGSLVLVTIEVSSRLRSIGASAFAQCHRLQFVDLPPNLGKMRKLFRGCNLSVLRLESLLWLSSIEESSCEKNRNLRSVLVPGSVVEIGRLAFGDCVSLSEVDFVLPSKLASIGDQSFAGCESLQRFRIVGSVKTIEGSFLGGSGVHSVLVDGDNSEFGTTEGFLVTLDGRSIVCYFGTDCDVRIPANIEAIWPGSFAVLDTANNFEASHSSQVRS